MTMNGIFLTKNHKCNFYHADDIGEKAYEEHVIQMKKSMFAQRKAEAEREEQEHFEHRMGYCPHCGGLIALNGICQICGTRKGE